jgi:hypothetical protein
MRDIAALVVLTVLCLVSSSRAAQKEKPKVETVSDAAAAMRGELPATFTVGTYGRIVVGSNCAPEAVTGLVKDLEEVEKKCVALVGPKSAASTGPIRAYYFTTWEGERATHHKLLGTDPVSAVGCWTSPPLRLWGSANVGTGTLAHELVHAIILSEWPNMPGWLNESLAVGVGCPRVGIQNGPNVVTDLWVLVGKKSLEKGKWAPLRETLKGKAIDYTQLDRTMVDLFPGCQVATGPLNTGRLLVRWLDATGKLPAFYQKCRDSKDPGTTLKSVASKDIDAVEQDLIQWVRRQDDANLLKKPD